MRLTATRRTAGPGDAAGLFGANSRTTSTPTSIAALLVVLAASGACSPADPPPADPTASVVQRPAGSPSTTSAQPSRTPDSQDFQTASPDVGRPAGSASRTQAAPVPTTTLPAGREGTPRGAPSGRVDRTDPDEVAQRFMIQLATIDTRLDNRPNDAAQRAAGLATPRLRRQLTSGQPIGPPGASFVELQRRGGWTTATAGLISLDLAPDKPGRVYRAVTATAVPTDGTWSGAPETTTAVLALARPGPRAPWAVDDYEALI